VLPHDYAEEEPASYVNLGNVESTHDAVEDHQLTELGSGRDKVSLPRPIEIPVRLVYLSVRFSQ
jgi:hypothetical protein